MAVVMALLFGHVDGEEQATCFRVLVALRRK
jgi:hypothetical protein